MFVKKMGVVTVERDAVSFREKYKSSFLREYFLRSESARRLFTNKSALAVNMD